MHHSYGAALIHGNGQTRIPAHESPGSGQVKSRAHLYPTTEVDSHPPRIAVYSDAVSDKRPVTDQDLTSLLDDARSDDAAAQRSRRRWLLQQAQSDARLSGLLLQAFEHGQTVTVNTTTGTSHTGRVAHVGPDFCALRTAAATTLVRLEAVATLVPGAGVDPPAAADHRAPPAVGPNFIESLAEQAADRPPVTLELRGQTHPVRGTLVGVGTDVATVELSGRGVVYVSLPSVAAVSFLGPG